MKIVIIGPTLLTRRCLEAILKKGGNEIAAVFALKNKYAPKKARFAIFDDLAEIHNFKLYKVDNINDEENIELIKKQNPDLILELGWSQIISEKIIQIPPKGCVGVHASMLPMNRGGASLNWALIKGARDWGISLYYLDKKIDAGKIIAQKKIVIDERDTITTLHDKSDSATIELLMENLPLIQNDKVRTINQDGKKTTYLSSRKPAEGTIIWAKTAKEIRNLIRGLSGDFPGAFVFLNDKKLFIWEAEIDRAKLAGVKPGEILGVSDKKGISVQTGKGSLLLERVQLEEDVPMWADDFAKKYGLLAGDILGMSFGFQKDAKKWLTDSGIQNKDGGFNAWYDLGTNSYPYIYSEITGYGITTLLYLNSAGKDNELIAKARKAADWLMANALLECGGILTRKYLDPKLEDPNYSFESGAINSFDTGMVLFGITALFKQTKEKKYLDMARRIADFLLTLQREDGLFEPVYNAKTKKIINTDEKWSTQSGSFHAKLALGLIGSYDILKDKKYKESAIRICDSALKFQKTDGHFVTFRDKGATHMHPHCYACEGLYYAGKKLKNDIYIKAALKGVLWALNSQLSDGGIPCLYDGSMFNRNQRSDTLAQVLRLATFYLNDLPESIGSRKSNIYDLASKLLSFQKTEGEQKGGFYYGNTEDGRRMDHLNSWCSMFAIQALNNLERYLNDQKISIDHLV